MIEGRPTLGDVASAAGVHKATASRALGEATAGRVHPATVQRVRDAATALGYRPNVYARGLRTRSSRTVGVIVPDIVNALYPPIVRGIEDALTPRGYSALLANTDLDGERERTAFDNLLARQVDGFLVGSGPTGRELSGQLADRGTPVVNLSDDTDLPGVDFDYDSGVDALVDLLVGLGHRDIAHVAGPAGLSDAVRRTDAFRRALARHGLDHAATFVTAADLTARGGADAFGRLLVEGRRVTAVTTYNDVLAVGVLRGVFAAGLSCPADISVAGFNDLPMVGDLTPSLTTVQVSGQQMGYTAAQMLLTAISGHGGPTHVRLPVSLVTRESTGPAKDG